MNRATSTILAAIISCLITVFVVHKWNPPQTAHRFPTRARAPYHIPQSYPYTPPSLSVPARPLLKASQRLPSCFTPTDCGPGAFCCAHSCYPAVQVNLSFVADDRADLWVCDLDVLKIAAATFDSEEVGTYDALMPCGYAYLIVGNTQGEGGASIYMQNAMGRTGASGTATLQINSETDSGDSISPAVRLGALDNTYPYNDFIENYGAYPVTDPFNSSARSISLSFFPTGC